MTASNDEKRKLSLADKLFDLHQEVRSLRGYEAISRIAVAIYDAKTDLLKTFLHSTDGGSPLDHYVARLSKVRSLQELAKTGEERVMNDLTVLAGAGSIHSQRIRSYRSSYTLPIRRDGVFYGFVFINADHPGFFTPEALRQVRPYAQIVALATVLELDSVRMIQAAVKTVREISHYRDEETGSHLERMSRYARLIAVGMADSFNLSDEFIEFLFQFAPLHDVGKIGIPDNILLKPGKLTDEEFAVMKTHVAKGKKIVDLMIRDFGLGAHPNVHLLHNVVAYHHEAMDGSGYPFGLKGDEIPLEARICAVADVFDALTSNRPYKKAWSNAEALKLLQDLAGKKFDVDCVTALIDRLPEIEEIEKQFSETVFD